MAKRLSDEGQHNEPQVIRLTMRDGSIEVLPTRERHETKADGKVVTIYYADFSRLADPATGQPLVCKRCGGHASRCREMPGCVEGGLVLVTIPKNMGGEIADYDYDYTCACDCLFGVWRHQFQHYAYADDQIGARPPEINLSVDVDMNRRMTDAQVKHAKEQIRKIIASLSKSKSMAAGMAPEASVPSAVPIEPDRSTTGTQTRQEGIHDAVSESDFARLDTTANNLQIDAGMKGILLGR